MPVSRAALEAAIRDSFLELVPVLQPSCQPSGAAVVQLPTYFQSNQPASLSRPGLRLLGFTVDLAATPTWTWRPAPGATINTSDPGGRWPDGTVSHVYRSPGTASVSVTASWSGTYRLDGAPAVAVPGGPVTQSASLSFPIREARAELVAGN